MERYVYVTYCDDIRQEVGGKLTLVGCYSSDLFFQDSGVSLQDQPIVLPKLCALVHAVSDIQEPFHEVKIRAYLNDDLLGETIWQGEQPAVTQGSDLRLMKFSTAMTFVPFAITEVPSKVRVECQFDDGPVLRGPGLKITTAQTHGAAQAEPSSALPHE